MTLQHPTLRVDGSTRTTVQVKHHLDRDDVIRIVADHMYAWDEPPTTRDDVGRIIRDFVFAYGNAGLSTLHESLSDAKAADFWDAYPTDDTARASTVDAWRWPVMAAAETLVDLLYPYWGR